jgi:hypothetical protein
MSREYKLIEITHEEHLTLADAGVWVQWDTDFGSSNGWGSATSTLDCDSAVRRAMAYVEGYKYKFYTRVEVDDNELQ